jgi:hypothetical protein
MCIYIYIYTDTIVSQHAVNQLATKCPSSPHPPRSVQPAGSSDQLYCLFASNQVPCICPWAQSCKRRVYSFYVSIYPSIHPSVYKNINKYIYIYSFIYIFIYCVIYLYLCVSQNEVSVFGSKMATLRGKRTPHFETSPYILSSAIWLASARLAPVQWQHLLHKIIMSSGQMRQTFSSFA